MKTRITLSYLKELNRYIFLYRLIGDKTLLNPKTILKRIERNSPELTDAESDTIRAALVEVKNMF